MPANEILGTWRIDAMYEDNNTVPFSIQSKFIFSSGGRFEYINAPDTDDESTESGSWRYESGTSTLTLNFEIIPTEGDVATPIVVQTITYNLVQLSAESMHWEIADENEIVARLEWIRT